MVNFANIQGEYFSAKDTTTSHESLFLLTSSAINGGPVLSFIDLYNFFIFCFLGTVLELGRPSRQPHHSNYNTICGHIVKADSPSLFASNGNIKGLPPIRI